MINQSDRLAALRQRMVEQGVDYYWIPGTDCHFSEYVPACWQRRQWISGFTGSAGSALVGLEGAWLWTDSRYFLQAQQQLDCEQWQLMRQGIDLAILPWLAQQAAGRVLGLDPWLMSVAQWQQWQPQLQQMGLSCLLLPENLLDAVWQDQPAPPDAPIVLWPEQYAGLSAQEKCDNVRVSMASQGVDALVVTALDSMAWLCNARGSDVDCNPVFIGYCMVQHEQAVLYIDLSKLNQADQASLQQQGIVCKSSADFTTDLAAIDGVVWIDAATTSVAVSECLANADLLMAPCPVAYAKAIKNQTEQAGMREAHRRDALALVRFMCWFEQHGVGLTEVTAAQKLLWFRQQDPHFKQPSFATICGYADHGAIIHYSATEQSAHTIGNEALLLLDSGGQYDFGTTDVTRTWHLGEPTEGERHHYTLVLKGHLALRHAQFPLGCCGEHLDAIARLPLWAEHLQYGHGTGHGVGCFLNVHEGPQRIAPAATSVALQAGMVLSNEPGVYFDGQYGIRIENLVLVEYRCGADDSATGHGPFLGFDDLTLVPYARALIDSSVLSKLEIKQINQYHERVYQALVDELTPAERQWLKQATEPLA